MNNFAEIAFNLPIDEVFTYNIINFPTIKPGMRVLVNFNNRQIEGMTTRIHNNEPNYKIKHIIKTIDSEPIINSDQIEIANWMKKYYISTFGESIFKMIPSGKRYKESIINYQFFSERIIALNQEQEKIYQNIKADLETANCHLLYGITGSGKTEIYIHLIHEVVNKLNRGAILLVPEITLTVQMINRLNDVFGENLALMHSGLKKSERFQSYKDLLSGRKKIAVGTRSAIFAPVINPGIIILDEEHDSSYKEHSNPRYHARQVAFYRSGIHQSVLLLGSATPSVEVYYQAKSGIIKLNELLTRANRMPLPKVTVQKSQMGEIISNDLLFQIKKRLDKKEQVILLLNRRGHSPLIYIKEKKSFMECPNCTANLCYHVNSGAVCHLCGYKTSLDSLRKISGNTLELQGTGTQKLEEYLLERFKAARIERLDQDSAKNREILSEVINRLINSEIDILTGTQMISKGLDAANVTLVGVINANIGLGLPDFRSQERVFSTLTQVAGRAGRSEIPGEVIIETNDPEHPVIQLAVKQNYHTFFQREIQIRKDLFYPPFAKIIRLIARSKDEFFSSELIEKVFAELLNQTKINSLEKTVILGPAPCPFYKIDSNYRNHIIIKTANIVKVKEMVKNFVKSISISKNAFLEIDIDPVDLL